MEGELKVERVSDGEEFEGCWWVTSQKWPWPC